MATSYYFERQKWRVGGKGRESDGKGGELDGEGGELAAKSRKAKMLMAKGKSMTSEHWTWGQDLGCLDFDLMARVRTIDERFQQ